MTEAEFELLRATADSVLWLLREVPPTTLKLALCRDEKIARLGTVLNDFNTAGLDAFLTSPTRKRKTRKRRRM